MIKAIKKCLKSSTTEIRDNPNKSQPFRREKRQYSLSDFEIKDTLGTGTFGRVRLVRHITDNAHLALKMLKKRVIIRTKQLEHIRSEISLLSMIIHPFIINMTGNFQDELRLYMVFEYVPGGEVFLHLRNKGRFEPELSKFYIAEIVLAFEYLHGMHIAYRDLKPENLLLSSRGHIKVTDFGFAKVVTDRTWTLCGTPEYLSPEIIQSQGHGRSADWWALGVLIYEMLAGYPPFYDETPFGVYRKVLERRYDMPKFFESNAKSLVRKLLMPDRTQRLGCTQGGAQRVKGHVWFNKTNWGALYYCQVQPPYQPDVSDDADTQNFDKYPESEEGIEEPLEGKEAEMFDDFDKM